MRATHSHPLPCSQGQCRKGLAMSLMRCCQRVAVAPLSSTKARGDPCMLLRLNRCAIVLGMLAQVHGRGHGRDGVHRGRVQHERLGKQTTLASLTAFARLQRSAAQCMMQGQHCRSKSSETPAQIEWQWPALVNAGVGVPAIPGRQRGGGGRVRGRGGSLLGTAARPAAPVNGRSRQQTSNP